MSNLKKPEQKVAERSGEAGWSDHLNKFVTYTVALGALTINAAPDSFIRACEKATTPAHLGCKTLPQDSTLLITTFVSTATSGTTFLHTTPVYTDNIRGIEQVITPSAPFQIGTQIDDKDDGKAT